MINAPRFLVGGLIALVALVVVVASVHKSKESVAKPAIVVANNSSSSASSSSGNIPPQTKVIANNPLSSWLYPNSRQLDSSSQELHLVSFDDSQMVTDWYKNQVSLQGFSSKSFINTNSNGNIVNQLVGNDGNRQVAVEIKRQSSSDQTFIRVSLDPEL